MVHKCWKNNTIHTEFTHSNCLASWFKKHLNTSFNMHFFFSPLFLKKKKNCRWHTFICSVAAELTVYYDGKAPVKWRIFYLVKWHLNLLPFFLHSWVGDGSACLLSLWALICGFSHTVRPQKQNCPSVFGATLWSLWKQVLSFSLSALQQVGNVSAKITVLMFICMYCFIQCHELTSVSGYCQFVYSSGFLISQSLYFL